MESAEMLRDGFRDRSDIDLDHGSHPAPGRGEGEPGVNSFAPDDGRRVTLEEYWAKWYESPYRDIDVSYEWNNGILEAKPPSNKPQLDLGNWFLSLLRRYLETHKSAALINMGTGFFMTMADAGEPSGTRSAVRKTDIGIILHSNPVSWGRIDQRSFDGVCDAVVESLSDSTQTEVRRDTEEKKRDYALAGVKEYTILDPSGRHMRFYRLTPEGRYEEIQLDAEGVLHSETLPGFQFRHKDLWRQPDLTELALDEVYCGYVLPGLREALAARRVAEKRAADAAARRKAEEQAADAAARRKAEEQAAADAAARRKAEERTRALEAELARLRRQSS